MKQIFLFMLSAGLVFTSCSKGDPEPEQPKTPLHALTNSKFVQVTGSGELTFDYNAYKPGKDLDKQTLEAASQTVNGNYGYDRVNVAGKTITSYFRKGSNVNPLYYGLTFDSDYHKKASTEKPWYGKVIILKTNNLVSKADFEKAVSVTVRAVNTGDEVTILEKGVTDNVIAVTFALTKANPSTSRAVEFSVQSNVAVTYSAKYILENPREGVAKAEVSIPKDNSQPALTNIGNNTTQYKGQLSANGAKDACRESVALWYWTTYVVPELQ